MSELKERLQATVRDLEQELAQSGPLDRESRDLLEQAAREIRSKLDATQTEGENPAESLVERVNTAARRFESTHPTLSGILERIADGLAQLGI
jgi:hypothetical protein